MLGTSPNVGTLGGLCLDPLVKTGGRQVRVNPSSASSPGREPLQAVRGQLGAPILAGGPANFPSEGPRRGLGVGGQGTLVSAHAVPKEGHVSVPGAALH